MTDFDILEGGRQVKDTQTPRTDAAETNWWSEDGLRSAFIVRAEFARELERENTTLTAERDEARRAYCLYLAANTGLQKERIADLSGWDCFDQPPNDIEAHEVRGDVPGVKP